ncbi:MAG: heavy metal translocating P-type ATPase [Caldilineaceae bacterium]
MNAKHTHHDESATASDATVDSTAPSEHAGHDHDGHMHHGEHAEATDHPGSGAYVVHTDHNPQADIVEPVAMDSHNAHVAPGHGEHSGHGAPTTHAAHAAADAHAGHGAHVDHSGHEQVFRRRFWICLALTVPVLLFSPMIQEWLGFTLPAFPGSEWMAPLFAIIIFLYGGIPFLQMAGPEIADRKPGMMLLISLAITVAFVYSLAMVFVDPHSGFFWEMALLIDVMLLGHWLEMRSVRQASGALNELAKLMPDTADRVRADGTIEQVPAGELRADDVVLVRPGASIPADGEVVEGRSDVNEALITGESKPVEKNAGSKVIGGSINTSGSLRVRVTATGDQTALAGIMRLVAEAQQSKSNTQVLADRAAGWLFYIALGVAALTAVVWIAIDGWNMQVIERVVTVLVIACPHALGLAVPLVVAISTSLAASNGILVRNRLALEAARDMDVVIFDKTGTLTKGEQGVVGMAAVPPLGENTALALTAAAEGDSEHIIARALREAAAARGLPLPPIGDFTAIQGRGVRVQAGGQTVHVGGPRLLEMLKLTLPPALQTFTDEAGRKGQTVVYLLQQVGAENAVSAAFALADVIRPESKGAVEELHAMGKQVALLTGDSRAVADAVAKELGIDQVFAEVLPGQKDEKVASLQAQGKSVAMVGDGVNDAPALTRADVGIAVGAGTDVAVESAGIILVRNNPADVAKAVRLSRDTYRKMVQNLWWATGYNIVALPLAAGILAPIGIELSPAAGAALMAVSTIVVAINAQTLRAARL